VNRNGSFGQNQSPTFLDKIGRKLSNQKATKAFRSHTINCAADIGCGYDARLGRSLFARADVLHLVDSAVHRTEGTTHEVIHEGTIPEILDQIMNESIDAILLNNVLEHIENPDLILNVLYQKLNHGGVLFINVPTWRGKSFLEMAAFKLKLAPEEEMNDHKFYYELETLWPLLRSAQFLPQNIKCKKHKFGLNLYAVCRK
jgi:SAM-dependent methyltransferase